MEQVNINVTKVEQDVTINATPNVTQIIVTTQNGGGTQNLNDVLSEGNATDGENIFISNGDEITFDNGSRIRKGLTDSGNGGAKGVALVCSLDYELKWEAGRQYVMQQDGFTIREVSHNFTITPSATDDSTKGFAIDSRWILDNGDIYVCTDATEDSAVWELQVTDVQDLQNVTDIGNTTTNSIQVADLDLYDSVNEGYSKIQVNDTSYIFNDYNGNPVKIFDAFGLEISRSENYILQREMVLTANRQRIEPDKDGTYAMLDDIPPVTGFVPYTGANANVDLGEYELKAGQIELDTTPTGTAGVAVTRWNNTIGSSETTLKGGNVILKNGVDLVARVVNKVTPNTTLTKASYQVVRISGAQGQRLAVNLAQANNDNNSADTLGVVCETIATNQEGFIMTVGQLENINTTGSLQGETWSDGDVLYLSPTTAGRLTNVKPIAPAHIVIVGYVEYAHANNGKIYVKIMNGWELDELHNVAISTPLNNQGLIYETSTDLWKNKTIDKTLVGLGNVDNTSDANKPVSTAQLTAINAKVTDAIVDGVTTIAPSQNAVFDALALKQNTLTNPITGTGANGQVAFFNGTTTQAGDNALFWDNTNKRLGVGTTTPTTRLDVRAQGALSTDIAFRVRNSADTANLLEVAGNGSTLLNGLQTLQGTVASDTASLGTELLTTGTGDASWTGTSFATGYTHIVGSVTTLTSTLAAVIGTFYQITYTVTGRTAGSFTIAFGGSSTAGITATGAAGPLASTTGTLVITPTTDFNGTIVLSIRTIGTSSATTTFRSSNGTASNEIRVSNITSNTFIGLNAGRRNTTGNSNTANGRDALASNTTGNSNTANGLNALFSNTTADNNTANGVSALFSNTTGNNNTANGRDALRNNTTGNNNTANGLNALFSNTTGNSNTANGVNALQNNTTGGNNTAIGSNALLNNTTGNSNIANGVNALRNNTTGFSNTANGVNALFSNTTGNSNTANGSNSLFSNTTGNNNTVNGVNALENNTIGVSNTANGVSALASNTTGGSNTANGLNAGRFIADGTTANTITNNSVFLGTNTRALADNQTNQIVIGNDAIGLGSNTVVLGNSSIIRTALRGQTSVNTDTVNASAQLQIDSTTRGFLPPRMTNAQRLAISSPAIGLMVYCTDATEGLYINKSTGWTFII